MLGARAFTLTPSLKLKSYHLTAKLPWRSIGLLRRYSTNDFKIILLFFNLFGPFCPQEIGLCYLHMILRSDVTRIGKHVPEGVPLQCLDNSLRLCCLGSFDGLKVLPCSAVCRCGHKMWSLTIFLHILISIFPRSRIIHFPIPRPSNITISKNLRTCSFNIGLKP